MEQDSEQFQPRRSNSERIPHCRFEIEGEDFMIAHDEEEPKTIQQALFNPNAKKWLEAMEEEMNSIEFGIWLIYRQVVGLLGTSGFSILNVKHMRQLKDIVTPRNPP